MTEELEASGGVWREGERGKDGGFGALEPGAAGRPLDEELAELIAERVAARLAEPREVSRRELIDANQVAQILGCKRSWVYEHKAELPLVRLGGGSRPRLRFDQGKVEAMALAGGNEAPVKAPPPARRRRGRGDYARRSPIKLLEIKGRAP